MRAAGHTTTMWCCLVLCARSSATDCPPVPAGHGGPARTANATALAARGRRDAPARPAPAPAPAAGVLRAVLQSRKFLLVLRNRVFVDRAFLTKSKHAAHAAFVASVASGQAGQRRLPLLGGHARPQAVVVPPGADGGHRQGRGRRRCGALVEPLPGPTSTPGMAEDVCPSRQSSKASGGATSARPCDKDAGNRARLGPRAERDARTSSTPTAPTSTARAAGPGPMRRRRRAPRRQDGAAATSPQEATTERCGAVPGARKMAQGYVGLANSRPQVSLASAGRLHGQLQPQSERLWRRGAVVLLWAAAAEFYCLQEGRTHLVVDACSAPSVIERLNADPRRAELARRRRGLPTALRTARGRASVVMAAGATSRSGPSSTRPEKGLRTANGTCRSARRATVAGPARPRAAVYLDLRNV